MKQPTHGNNFNFELIFRKLRGVKVERVEIKDVRLPYQLQVLYKLFSDLKFWFNSDLIMK